MGCNLCKSSVPYEQTSDTPRKRWISSFFVTIGFESTVSTESSQKGNNFISFATRSPRDSENSGSPKMIKNYVYQKHLGTGSFGKVRLFMEAETGQLVAIKSMKKKILLKKKFGMNKGRTPFDDVMREIAILQKLNHQNVIKLYEAIDDSNDDKIHIVMEYAENGPLFEGEDTTAYIRTISDQTLCHYFVQIVKGMEYVHSRGIIHRDIKPGNILVGSKGVIKIADFGVSFLLGSEYSSDDSEGLKQTVGSPAFLPPELCANDHHRIDGPPIDVWALGVTLYFLAFGRLPFEGETESLLYDNVKSNDISFPEDSDLRLQNLIKDLLVKNPDDRISLPQVLSHPWVLAYPYKPEV